MKQLFPALPLIRFEPDSRKCDCSGERKVLKTQRRTIATLAIGQLRVHETITCCDRCQSVTRSESLRRLVPQYGKFGFDVIVHVGTELFVKSRGDLEIQQALAERNIPISLREIGTLGARFITYLALVHQEADGELKNLLGSNGGYVLHLDGTCEGNSPHLMTALDEFSEIVLGNVKLPSENTAMIVPFLKQFKRSYGQPLALVHDMGTGILDAIRQVFPRVPDFICHFHFLRDIGKDLFDHEHVMLRNGFKKYRSKTQLRSLAKKLRQQIQDDPKCCRTLESIQLAAPVSQIVRVYLLVLWILDYAHELDGIGFPFDRAQLAFYERIKKAWDVTLMTSDETMDDMAPLKRTLSPVMQDHEMERMAERLREKTALFDQLRKAMRIAMPDTDHGLNDDGTDCDMMTIKAKVTSFRKKLVALIAKMAQPDIAYKKMLKQIDKYWEKLFADPIAVKTANGILRVQPQRTNNLLERFFRDFKKRCRKKSGAHSMSRILKTMLADTPLVRNLQNEHYMKALLNGAPDLPTRFAQVESVVVRNKLREDKHNPEQIPAPLKKLLRMPGVPTTFVPSFGMRIATNRKS